MGLLFKNNSKNHNEKGFTLIEVAMGLIVLGLAMIPAMYQYEQYLREEEQSKTSGNIQVIQTALQKYVYRFGRYPRPSDLSLAPGAVGFGQEVAIASIITCPSVSGQVCRASAAAWHAAPNTVLIGTVPFATLGLPLEYATDAYLNKFTYAVTESLTDSTTFVDTNGVIRIYNEGGGPTNGVSDNAQYVVVSHGRDRAGAYTLTGIKTVPCSITLTKDQTNCSNTAWFNDNFGNYAIDSTGIPRYLRVGSTLTGVNHYDDYLYHMESISADIWTRQADPVQPVSDIYNRNLNNVRIGAGPVPVARLEINGTATTPANMRSDKLDTNRFCLHDALGGCDTAGGTGALVDPKYQPKVFRPEIIGGTGTATPNDANANKAGGGINCGPGVPLTGIKDSDEKCTYGNVLPVGVITGATGPNTGGICDVGYGAHNVINGKLQCVLIP